jgi:predicted dehydrogenase
VSAPVVVGVIGLGAISDLYLEHLAAYDHLAVKACADLSGERARAQAERFGIAAVPTEELIADPEIELVVNLTNPAAHAEVGLAAVRAGKSVYNEKPLALDRALARQLLDEAREHGVRVGGAPDTWLGKKVQTARAILAAGTLGEPVAATTIVYGHGHESWHGNPDYFYKPGGGPVLDGAPYFIGALVALLGPVARVTGSARASFPERTITTEQRKGEKIEVEVPTHVGAILELASGLIVTTAWSWDVWSSDAETLCEIHGSLGTLSLGDVDDASADPRIRIGELKPAWGSHDYPWTEVPRDHGPEDPTFGIGIAEMAAALRSGRPHRASGDFAYHVLDVMQAIHEAAEQGRHVRIESTCERPAPIGPGWLAEHGL